MKKLQHSVLTDDGILTGSGWKNSKIQISRIETISDVADLARTHNLLQIWILSGTKIFNRLALHHKKFMQSERYGFAPTEIKNLITVWGGGVRCQIIFAGELKIGSKNNLARENLINQWALFEITDAKRLFDAIAWLYERTKTYPSVPIRFAKRLAEISANEKLEALSENTEIYHANVANDLIFLDKTRANGKKYIYGFDKNSAYLTAAASYQFGLGDSIAQVGGEFNKNLHGLWRVEIDCRGLSPERANYIRKIKNENEMLWTSDIEIIIELGAKIRVIAARVWRNNKRIFEKFYKILSGAIIEAKIKKLTYERASLKAAYTRFFGWMNRQPHGREEIFYRPDWRSAIISLTRANMVRNVFSIRDAMPEIEIVGVFRDALILATNESDISKLPFPLADTENRNSPYKLEYSFDRNDVSEYIAEATGAGDLSGKLKKLWSANKTKNFQSNISEMPKISEVKYAA